jgi:FixJ family two-component response regulator
MGRYNNCHIYVVDDEPQVCKAVSQILRQKYTVTCFETAEACYSRLSESACRCDLLISDIKMPDMSGLELLERVKRVRPLLEVLLITGYGDIPLAVKAIKAGAWDFIEKPLYRHKLLEAVKTALEKHFLTDPIMGKPLSRKEKEVLKLILAGYSNRQIAEAFGRSIRTVEDQRLRLMRKLEVDNLVDLVQVGQKIDLSEVN